LLFTAAVHVLFLQGSFQIPMKIYDRIQDRQFLKTGTRYTTGQNCPRFFVSETVIIVYVIKMTKC